VGGDQAISKPREGRNLAGGPLGESRFESFNAQTNQKTKVGKGKGREEGAEEEGVEGLRLVGGE